MNLFLNPIEDNTKSVDCTAPLTLIAFDKALGDD